MRLQRLKANGRRRGIVVVFVAVTLVVLVGFVAIVVDGGMMQDRRRHLQASADAAAYAAAAELFLQDPTSQGLDTKQDARRSALAICAANGYIDDNSANDNCDITINVPPITGKFAGLRNHAAVTIEYKQRRYFSGVFGGGSLTVKARAVARGAWAPVNDGILVLDLNEREALKVNGGGTSDVDAIMIGADVIVNSYDPAGTTIVGNADMTSMDGYDLTGGYSTSGGGTLSGPVTSGVPPTPDPLRYLQPPDPSTLTVQRRSPLVISGQRDVVLEPGIYEGGIKITSMAYVTMLPGIYYLPNGGFSVSGQSTLIAEGVMIYSVPNDQISNGIDLTGGGTVTITPMTTGPYAGISLWQDRNADVPLTIVGSAGLTLTGTIYAASAPVQIDGNGAVTIGSQYISRTLTIGGNGAVNIAYDPVIPPKRRVYMLVE